eukprot:jgi/Chrzof1/6304/Cz18g01020.t1
MRVCCCCVVWVCVVVVAMMSTGVCAAWVCPQALQSANICACSRMQELVLGVLEHGSVQHQSFTVQLEHDALHRHSFRLQLELSWPAASKVSPCIRSADGFKH